MVEAWSLGFGLAVTDPSFHTIFHNLALSYSFTQSSVQMLVASVAHIWDLPLHHYIWHCCT